jgi:hypothetical protein
MELKRSRQVDSRHEEHKKASHAHIICPGGHIIIYDELPCWIKTYVINILNNPS